MPATLSPFRYLQVVRYAVQWWIDTVPGLQARRRAAQARAAQFVLAPSARGRALAASAMGRAAVMMDPKSASSDKGAAVAVESAIGSSMPPLPTNIEDLPPRPDRHPDPRYPPENTEIYRLMNDERAFLPGTMKPPREVVVLCHGLYGFSTATPIPLFPSLKLHYWASVLEVLRDRMGAKVVVVGVKGTGSIEERAAQMHSFLKSYLPKGVGVNFVAHSMGGLDCRHLISTIRPTEYKPLSLTTIATPHHGSPFMDWCAANIGVGSGGIQAKLAEKQAEVAKGLPFTMKAPLLALEKDPQDTLSSFTSALTNYLLGIFDSPAYHNLTTSYLRDHFNPATPDDPNVKYLSVAGRISKMSVLHPLWFPKLVLDSAAEKGYPLGETRPGLQYEGNDGLVSVASSKWGEFMGVVDGCHHWDLRGEGGLWPQGGSIKLKDEIPMDWAGAVGLDASNTRDPCDAAAAGAGQPLKRDSQLDPAQHARDLATARAMSPGDKPKDSHSAWDLAQVGELIDWVGDLFPGDKKESDAPRQLSDARKEMAATSADKAKKVLREKFDLARFYGGLMLRLREDGL